MRKENEYMRHNLKFVIKGGDVKELDNSEVRYLVESEDAPDEEKDPFKTP